MKWTLRKSALLGVLLGACVSPVVALLADTQECSAVNVTCPGWVAGGNPDNPGTCCNQTYNNAVDCNGMTGVMSEVIDPELPCGTEVVVSQGNCGFTVLGACGPPTGSVGCISGNCPH